MAVSLLLGWRRLERPHRHELVVTDEPIIRNGYIQMPEAPGLGVELNEEVAKKYLRAETGFFQ